MSSEKIARSSDQSVAGPAVATVVETSTASERRRGAWLAILAVLFFSTSPVLVRLAEPLSAYEKTAGRLAVAALALLLLMRVRREPFHLTRRDLPLFIGIGLIAALHFVAYVASLNFTTIAHSLAIVYTAPIFVAIFSAWFLHEPIRPRQWLGVLVAVLGVAILAGFEPNWSARMAVGDLLALLSAIMFGLYSVAGRQQRSSYPLFTYAVAVYGLAALWVLPAAAANFTPAGYTLVRHTHATTANLIATQEVTLGILLGALILGEMPQFTEMAGVLVTLLGIVMVLI